MTASATTPSDDDGDGTTAPADDPRGVVGYYVGGTWVVQYDDGELILSGETVGVAP